MRRAIRRLRAATFRLGLRAASQLHSPGGSETEGVSLAASERRPGQLPLRRAFCLLARLCRRARLSILAGGAALESTLGSGGRLELSQRRMQRIEARAVGNRSSSMARLMAAVAAASFRR